MTSVDGRPAYAIFPAVPPGATSLKVPVSRAVTAGTALRSSSSGSSETVMTTASPARSRAMRSRSGISVWQAPHQVAQKFTSTTLPR